MQFIPGKSIADSIKGQLRPYIADLASRGTIPALAIVQVGNDPASDIYVGRKLSSLRELGLLGRHVHVPGAPPSSSNGSQGNAISSWSREITQELVALIARLNADPSIHGIILQLPLPRGIDAGPILQSIDPAKDVDGLTLHNQGALFQGLASSVIPSFVPATPLGCWYLVQGTGRLRPGAVAAVVGRSILVGRPMAALMLNSGCSLIQVHSRSLDVPQLTRRADILVSATGQMNLITDDYIKPGAVVIDVGVTRGPDGKLGGDVDATKVTKADFLTPVPGGVGPMTVAMLMLNVVQAALTQSTVARSSGTRSRVLPCPSPCLYRDILGLGKA